MSAIEDLEKKVERLRNQLGDAERKLRKARVDAAPVKIGDVIATQRNGEMRVSRVAFTKWGRMEITANPRKKNGKWSKAERNVYGEWTKL